MLIVIKEVLYIIFQIFSFTMLMSILSSWIPSIREIKLFNVVCEVGDSYLDIFRGKIILGIFDLGTIFGLIIYEYIIGLLI